MAGLVRSLLLGLLLLLAGCAPGAIGVSGAGGLPELSVEGAEYRLGSGDRLRITVFNEPDLSGEFLVSTQGSVAFPLVGDVQAGGKTLNDFSRHLEQRLRDGFVREPRVSAEVLNYRPFFILGEVGAPGTYPFSANLTVLNAVATAGGFSVRADLRRVFIKHAGQDQEKEYALTSTTPVQPGDTVRIVERRF